MGGLQSEEFASHDGSHARVLGPAFDFYEIVDRAVHEASPRVATVDGWNEGIRSRGEDQPIVGHDHTLYRGDGSCRPIDGLRAIAEMDDDVRSFEKARLDQR